MGTVVLIIGFTDLTLETRLNLSADADTVADLTGGHFVTSFDDFADNFVAHANGQWAVAPTASDSMNVGATNTACFDLDVDIAILKWLWLELWEVSVNVFGAALLNGAHYLFLFKLRPLLLIIDHKPLKGIWIAHLYESALQKLSSFRAKVRRRTVDGICERWKAMSRM